MTWQKTLDAIWWLGILPGIAFFLGYVEGRYRARLARAVDRLDMLVAFESAVARQSGVLITDGFPGETREEREARLIEAVDEALRARRVQRETQE